MPIDRRTAGFLAGLVHELRPAWDTAGILKVLGEYAHAPAPPHTIAHALIRAAVDTGPDGARTPAAIRARTSYWNNAWGDDTPGPAPRLTPEHECRLHPGQWRSTCSPCAVDHLPGWDDPDPDAPPLQDPRAAARAAAGTRPDPTPKRTPPTCTCPTLEAHPACPVHARYVTRDDHVTPRDLMDDPDSPGPHGEAGTATEGDNR